MHLFSNRTQMTTNDGKNKIASHGSYVSDAMTCCFEFFYDLLLTEARPFALVSQIKSSVFMYSLSHGERSITARIGSTKHIIAELPHANGAWPSPIATINW